MASRMRVTSLMDEARCYQALPITSKTIGHKVRGLSLSICRTGASHSRGVGFASNRKRPYGGSTHNIATAQRDDAARPYLGTFKRTNIRLHAALRQAVQ